MLWQVADVPINNLSGLMDKRGKAGSHTQHLRGSLPHFRRVGGGQETPPASQERVCVVSLLSSTALGAACERRTHLLFSKNPEVMELFNQGVGTASCWEEEELITEELFPFSTVMCSHCSHDCR